MNQGAIFYNRGVLIRSFLAVFSQIWAISGGVRGRARPRKILWKCPYSLLSVCACEGDLRKQPLL